MNEEVVTGTPASTPAQVILQAEPEALEIDLKRTAVIVIDMQNAFLAREVCLI